MNLTHARSEDSPGSQAVTELENKSFKSIRHLSVLRVTVATLLTAHELSQVGLVLAARIHERYWRRVLP